MKLQILKGADEIGGNCIKLQTNNTTVIIDYGTPLNENSKQVKLPKGVDACTSGHADIETLQKFVKELKPKKVVPIHTEYKEEFEKYFDKVMVLENGESFDLENDNLSSYQVKKLNELFRDDFLV